MNIEEQDRLEFEVKSLGCIRDHLSARCDRLTMALQKIVDSYDNASLVLFIAEGVLGEDETLALYLQRRSQPPSL